MMKMKIPLRAFLKAIIVLAAVISFGCGLNNGSDNSAEHSLRTGRLQGVEFLRQIVATDNAISRTIMWQTKNGLFSQNKKGGKNLAVAYRLQNAKYAVPQFVAAQCETFTDDGETKDIYTAKLTGLLPGKIYEYCVTFGDDATGWQKLQTPADGGFQCLVFPDSQSSDYGDWEKLANDAARRHKDAEMFINMGDLVDNGEQKSHWRAWFASVEKFAPSLAFAPVMGNHETYDNDWQVRQPKAYLACFAVPENGSQNFGRWYYSFDYGNCHFAVLNTQSPELQDSAGETAAENLIREQIAWLENDLAKTKKRWKIVLMHRDVLQYRIKSRPERKEGFDSVASRFMPSFEKGNVDLVLTAHLHTYRNRGRIYHYDHAAKGPHYVLTGVAGNVRYPGLWTDHALDVKTAPQPETDNYLVLTATPDSLILECFLPDGTSIDKLEIRN